jgi:hypothetical protein
MRMRKREREREKKEKEQRTKRIHRSKNNRISRECTEKGDN